MSNDNKNANNGKKYGTAYLTFTNLKGSAYKKGNLIVESVLKKESKNSPLCKLASFTDMVVEDCALNESKTGTNISVCVNAVGEDNMKRLYEWLKKYTNESMIPEIAPGLLESLGLTNNEEQVNEDSVASRFSKYRKLYEADDEEEPDKDKDNKDDEDSESKDENSDSAGESKKEEDGDDPEDGEDEEELTAVIIEVKKGDEDAAKQEMIDAGVDEDDIEILESEKDDDEGDDEGDDANEDNAENESEDDDKDADDSSDETVKIKVSIDSFDALKEYLEGKGFDLEEELGGEIVTDDDDEDSEGDGDEKEKDEMEDTFDGFDDLFGDMGDDENDEKK